MHALPGPAQPSGLIAVLSCVEPCRSYELHRNPQTKHLELRPAIRKCRHYYFDLDHPVFGPMHVRLQTWLPFQIKVVLNGRDWLARQLDAAGIGYLKKDNTFVALDDFGWCSSPARCAVAGQLADSLERVGGPVPSGARRVDARLLPGGLLLVGRAERVGHGCGIPLGGGLGGFVSPAGASWDHDIQQPGRAAVGSRSSRRKVACTAASPGRWSAT